MSFSNFVVFEIRTTGNDTNGGGWISTGSNVDYSQQDNPVVAVTDAVCNANSSTITSASASFTSAMIGNVCYFAGGTGNATPRWWQITGVTNSNTITVDVRGYPPTTTNTTGATLRVGGALASPGAFGQMVSQQPGDGMIGWVRKGTYQITTNTQNVSGGRVNLYSGSDYSACTLIGYDTNRGDRTGTRPLIQATAGITGILFNLYGYAKVGTSLFNLDIDGANQSSTTAVSGNGATYGTAVVRDCVLRNCTTGIDAATNSNGLIAIANQAISCTTGYLSVDAIYCEAISCTTGFSRPFGDRTCRSLRRCLARNCTTGFSVSFANMVSNCLAVGGTTGFTNPSASDPPVFIECIASGCSGRGWNLARGYNIDCATYNCGLANILPPTSGNITSLTPWLTDSHFNLTADPFVDSANNDYRLNTAVGGGAVLRNAGLKLPSQLLASDVGPVQGVYGGSGGGLLLSRAMNGGYSA